MKPSRPQRGLTLLVSALLILLLNQPAASQEEKEQADGTAEAEAPAAEAVEGEPAEGEKPEAEALGDAAGDTPADPAKPKGKAAAAAAKGPARTVPELFLGTPSLYWVVDFEPRGLRMISPKEGLGAGRVYWYLLYHLSNPLDKPVDLFVDISAVSDNNKQYVDLFLPSVERAIEKKEGDPNLWGKTDEVQLISKRNPQDPKYHYTTLKAGEKRKCVAVFNRMDPNANHVTISVAGLSNEVGRVSDESGAAPKEIEERIRELYFERLGDEFAPTLDVFQLKGMDWKKRRLKLGEAVR